MVVLAELAIEAVPGSVAVPEDGEGINLFGGERPGARHQGEPTHGPG